MDFSLTEYPADLSYPTIGLCRSTYMVEYSEIFIADSAQPCGTGRASILNEDNRVCTMVVPRAVFGYRHRPQTSPRSSAAVMSDP